MIRRLDCIKTPSITLNWLQDMTDDTGLLQHSNFSIPNRREGYATDDNARALIAALKYHILGADANALKLAKIYLSFLLHMQKKDGQVHTFMGYNRNFLRKATSDDTLGRVLWSCGYSQELAIPQDFRMVAKEVFDKGLDCASQSPSLRAHAFTILGLCHYAKAFPQDKNPPLRVIQLADGLCEAYRNESASSWHWFESSLTYANSRIPQALFRAYQTTKKEDYLHIAERSFDFLAGNTIIKGVFHPVGNRSWYKKGGEMALYDQQPIEASCMVEAASTAFQITGKDEYSRIAQTAFDWFMGKNSKKVAVYNPTTGGCYDGITPEGLNMNQGAEAGLSYLLARLEMKFLTRNP
jgi:hypothetical protein